MIAVLYDDAFAGAAITTNGEASTMPAVNVALKQPTDAARLTDASPRLTFDLGSAKPVQLLAPLYHTAAEGDTVRIRAATSEAALTSGPDFDRTIQARMLDQDGWGFERHHGLLWLDGPVSYRWWQMDFVATPPLDIGAVMGGLPLVLPGPDFGLEWVPPTDRRAREVAFQCSVLPERDVHQSLMRMERIAGVAEQVDRSLGANSFADQSVKRVLVAQDPGGLYGMDRTMVAFLTSVDGFRVQRTPASNRRYLKRYVFQEMELP